MATQLLQAGQQQASHDMVWHQEAFLYVCFCQDLSLWKEADIKRQQVRSFCYLKVFIRYVGHNVWLHIYGVHSQPKMPFIIPSTAAG